MLVYSWGSFSSLDPSSKPLRYTLLISYFPGFVWTNVELGFFHLSIVVFIKYCCTIWSFAQWFFFLSSSFLFFVSLPVIRKTLRVAGFFPFTLMVDKFFFIEEKMENFLSGSAAKQNRKQIRQHLSYLVTACNMAYLPVPPMLWLQEPCLLFTTIPGKLILHCL